MWRVPATPEPPAHPLPALTTSELSRYRLGLERALKSLLGRDPARQEVQRQLAAAIAEQDSRTAIARSSRP